MLLTGIQFCVIFIALFITTYLLSALVDFDADGRGMTLHKTAASILFPFYRGTRFNSASVILQISNYIFGIMYVLSVILGDTGDIVVEALGDTANPFNGRAPKNRCVTIQYSKAD